MLKVLFSSKKDSMSGFSGYAECSLDHDYIFFLVQHSLENAIVTT